MITTSLRRARRAAGQTLREVGQRSGVGYSNVSQIENGHRDPTALTAERIATALGVKLIAVPKDNRTTAADAADAIRDANSEAQEYRAFLELAKDLQSTDAFNRVLLAAETPALTGTRWDDAIAGLVEWTLQLVEAPIPGWVHARDQRGETWEPRRSNRLTQRHPSDLSLAPEPLRRRGIAIEAGELGAA